METTNTVTRTVVPKNTLITLDNGIVHAKDSDNDMFSILIDKSKHAPFFNAKGDKETFVKTGWQETEGGIEINVQARRVKTSAEKQAKNIREKIAKVIAGKAKDGDVAYLATHGFANETGDGLDMGKVEATYLDNVARAAKERAEKLLLKAQKEREEKVKAAFVANNGSLANGANA